VIQGGKFRNDFMFSASLGPKRWPTCLFKGFAVALSPSPNHVTTIGELKD